MDVTREEAAQPGQEGYVMAMTALLLIPLMVFAAFAVDLGSWYAEADKAQRAADAAALAAVVVAPDPGAVTAEAVRVAALNGIVDVPGPFDPNNPTYPHVIAVATSDVQVDVTIIVEAKTFFGSVILNNFSIEREASADYTRPLAMGNPSSALGTGVDTEYPSGVANFWLNIQPPTVTRRDGDLITATTSDNGSTNDYHDSARPGYLYGVDIPGGGSYELQARLTCQDDQTGTLDLTLYPPETSVTPNYLLDNLTLVTPDFTDLPFNEVGCVNPYDFNDDPEEADWQTVSNSVSGTSGEWLLQAEHGGGGRVLYSLRVINTGGGPAHCSTIPTVAVPNPVCPTIRPVNWLGAYTHLDMFPALSTTPTELYLAEVDPVNARSTLRVLMFDTADGIEEVKILLPPRVDGGPRTYAPFTWRVVAESGNAAYTPTAADYAACTGGDSCVTRDTGGQTFFQDKLVEIDVDLSLVPGGYTCQSDCWFKVEYSNDGTTTETTTWSADLVGDPIRLIE